MNPREPPEDASDAPDVLPSKKKAKRKRAYSRSLRKGAPNQKSCSSTHDEIAQPSDVHPSDPLSSESASIRQSAVSSNASSRRWSRADYQKELKVALEQISQLQSVVDTQSSQLKVSESKRRKVMEAHERAKQGVKEQKQKAKEAESEASTSSKALADAQHHAQAVVAEAKKVCKVCTSCLSFLLSHLIIYLTQHYCSITT